jgi:hypothetical protein
MEILMLRVAALLCTLIPSVAHTDDERNCDPCSGRKELLERG